MLKDDLDLVNLKFLSYPRLIKPLLQFMARNPDIELNSNRVRITIDKFGRTVATPVVPEWILVGQIIAVKDMKFVEYS